MRVEAFGFGIWAEENNDEKNDWSWQVSSSLLSLAPGSRSSLTLLVFLPFCKRAERTHTIQYVLLVVIPGHGGGSNGSA